MKNYSFFTLVCVFTFSLSAMERTKNAEEEKQSDEKPHDGKKVSNKVARELAKYTVTSKGSKPSSTANSSSPKRGDLRHRFAESTKDSPLRVVARGILHMGSADRPTNIFYLKECTQDPKKRRPTKKKELFLLQIDLLKEKRKWQKRSIVMP